MAETKGTKTDDFAFVSVDDVLSRMKGEELTSDIFIGDSATTTNMTFDKSQMYNCMAVKGKVTVSTGKSAKVNIVGRDIVDACESP